MSDNELISNFMESDYSDIDMSWNALMPIIDKIENIYFNGFPIVVNMSKSGAYICINNSNCGGDKFEEKFPGVKRKISDTLNINYFVVDKNSSDFVSKMESTYLAVIDFIYWYNDNKENCYYEN